MKNKRNIFIKEVSFFFFQQVERKSTGLKTRGGKIVIYIAKGDFFSVLDRAHTEKKQEQTVFRHLRDKAVLKCVLTQPTRVQCTMGAQ